MNKKKKQKIFISVIVILILLCLFLFVDQIFIDIIKCQINNDFDGMRQIIIDKGIIGIILVIFLEALQMIAVIFSAEFLQTAAAMSYPWYIALIICDIGVLIGATAIYYLVKSFKFDSSIFKNSSKKINQVSKKSVNIQMIMYLLFLMPIVPFGAICYYGSSENISYKKYAFTCATGAIPSILSSIFLGKAITLIIFDQLSIWVLLAVVAIIMVFLFTLSTILISKAFPKEFKNTPDSSLYMWYFRVFRLLCKNKVKFNKKQNLELEAPFLILSNHPSPYDVYYTTRSIYPERPTFILNRYYFRKKLYKKLLEQIGVIPKKLFSPDMETIKKTLKTIKAGYSVFMCPEGRLGIDGRNYPSTIETGKFIKQLKLPILILNIRGAYIAKPKWRKKQMKSKVRVDVSRVITKDEVLNYSVEEINDIINEGIKYNDFEYIKENNIQFKNKNKACGLENVMYYCPKCHKEHTITSNNNTLTCTNCGFKLSIDINYQFEENEFNIKNLPEYYDLLRQYEQENIKRGIDMSCEVRVVKFNFTKSSLNEKGYGKCYLNNNEFRFEGNLKVKEFTHNIKDLKALAFGCGEEFECYYDNELYYFYPTTNKSQCTKWALIVDELQNNGENNE